MKGPGEIRGLFAFKTTSKPKAASVATKSRHGITDISSPKSKLPILTKPSGLIGVHACTSWLIAVTGIKGSF
jgi:hypothetical protein